MRSFVAGLAVLLVAFSVVAQVDAATLTFPSGTDIPGTIQDAHGCGTGFPDRLPGTGASLPTNDSNLDLSANPGWLTITSTTSDWFAGSGDYYDPSVIEAPGILLHNVGTQDITIRAGFRSVQLNNWSDQLGIYAGTSIDQNVKAMLHMELLSQYGPVGLRNYLFNSQTGPTSGVNNFEYPDSYQTPPATALFSNGDNIDLTLSRVDDKWSMSWTNLFTGNTGNSGSYEFPFTGDDLYVGLTYQNPRSTSSNTSMVEYFSVDVAPVPEPSTFVMWATGAIGLLAYAWRKRRVP